MESEKLFYNNTHERILTYIKIVSTKRQKDSKFFNPEYIVFTFRIITPFYSWFISKRYTQIKEFYD